MQLESTRSPSQLPPGKQMAKSAVSPRRSLASTLQTKSSSQSPKMDVSHNGYAFPFYYPNLNKFHVDTAFQVQVPLSAPSPALVDMSLPRAELSLLPSVHLDPKTLVGGGGQDRETVGQLYAAQIASHLALRNPDDRRTLLLGLGLRTFDSENREGFFDLIELVLKAL